MSKPAVCLNTVQPEFKFSVDTSFFHFNTLFVFFSLSPVPESLQSSMPLCNSEHDQTNADLGPDCYSRLCEEPLDAETERPVSLVSTLSSDSSSRDSRSLFGSTITLPVSTTPPLPCGEDIDLELSPAEGQAGDHSPYTASTRNHWLERLESKGISSQWNKNNDVSNRKASPEIPHIHASPVVTSAMAPNPNLTYADRVVMELIETERMYVKDLSSIVEVSGHQLLFKLNFPKLWAKYSLKISP